MSVYRLTISTYFQGIFLSEMPGLTADGRENPYFGGQKLPIAAKKGMDF